MKRGVTIRLRDTQLDELRALEIAIQAAGEEK